MNKCPRCGKTETFKSDCLGALSKELEWCSKCGYLMEPLENLANQIEKDLKRKVLGSIELPKDEP